MAFNWKSALGRLDPRKWNVGALGPTAGKTRDFVVANRNAVLAVAVALLAGLWGGAVLGRVSAGGGGGAGDVFSAISGGGNHETPRSAGAPRGNPNSAQ